MAPLAIIFREWLTQVQSLFASSGQSTATHQVLIPQVFHAITLCFVGHLGGAGVDALAAYALGAAIVSVTGNGIVACLCDALAVQTRQHSLQLRMCREKYCDDSRVVSNEVGHETHARGGSFSFGNMSEEEEVVFDDDDESSSDLTSLLQSFSLQDQSKLPSSRLTPSSSFTEETEMSAESHRNPNTDEILSDTENAMIVDLVRGVFVNFVVAVLIVLFWCVGGANGLLRLALGEDGALVKTAESYLRTFSAGFCAYSIHATITAYLHALDLCYVPTLVSLGVAVVHWPLCHLFINVLDHGYGGAAMAMSASHFLRLMLLTIYLKKTSFGMDTLSVQLYNRSDRDRPSWDKLVEEAISSPDIAAYVRSALSYLPLVASDHLPMEIALLMAGGLYPAACFAVSTMAIYQCMRAVCLFLPILISDVGESRVEYLLSINEPHSAKTACRVNAAFTGIISCISGGVMFFQPYPSFPSVFTNNPIVIHAAATATPLLFLDVLASGIRTSLGSTMRGCGRQMAGIPIALLSYWIIGFPLSYFMAFRRGGTVDVDNFFHGVDGIAAGLVCGTWLYMNSLAIVMIYTMDWGEVAIKTQIQYSLQKQEMHTKALRRQLACDRRRKTGSESKNSRHITANMPKQSLGVDCDGEGIQQSMDSEMESICHDDEHSQCSSIEAQR